MKDPDDIWAMEEGFWLDGPDFFRRHQAPDAIMAFPGPVGVIQGEAIVRTLEGAPRWDSVQMDRRSMAQAPGATAIAYRATGQREGQPAYHALCTTTYAATDGDWLLLAHQQTPLMPPEG